MPIATNQIRFFRMFLVGCVIGILQSCSSDIDIFSGSPLLPIEYCFLNGVFAPQTLYQDLMPGSRSGFSFIFYGLGDTDDEPATYIGRGKFGQYWSQTKLHSEAALSHWIVTFDDVNHWVLSGYNKLKYWYAVRCVKNAN